MADVVRKWSGGGEVGLNFRCPGCKEIHSIRTSPNGWGWNGSLDKPTFTPSVLVRSGHFVPGHEKGGKGCWCKYNADCVAAGEEESGFNCGQCHSFVRDGKIEFLSDCTHALAGQTVDLPPWQEE